MPGSIILAGGHEVRPGCEPMDRRVLEAAGGAAARVVFLPTAVAAYDPHGSIRGAVAYFARLGVNATGVAVLTREDAEREDYAAAVRAATLVYLGGGDPAHLLETLRGSAVWRAIRDVNASGAVVGGSSAGAMVLCDWIATPPAWQPRAVGLGVVRGAIVQPHFQSDRLEQARARIRALPEDIVALGIPEQSGLLGGGRNWTVVGPGPVTVVSAWSTSTFQSGETATW